MAEETEQTEQKEVVATETQTTEIEQQTTETPHPLSPGGARFEEVYAKWKMAEDRASRAEGEAQAYRQQQQRPQQQQVDPAQMRVFLQQQIDQGRITPVDAMDIISRHNAQQAATQTTIVATQAQQLNAKIQSAFTEVNQYLDKLPSLRDNSSQDFQRVSAEAYRVAEDMNLPVTDGRVQRVALRAVYGPLDRLAAASTARAQSRDASLPHTETNVSRGATQGATQTTATKGDPDPLKDIDPTYIAHWERKGYTRERMIEEAAYIPKGRKVRTGSGARTA